MVQENLDDGAQEMVKNQEADPAAKDLWTFASKQKK